ncbi:MAG: TCP-1/cpn60 chaperonin family protein [Thermomicrobiales bacterium]
MVRSRFDRRIVFAPGSHRAFDRGVEAIARAIRPTLGPIARTVAVERGMRTISPEVLDDGASIARRITSLGDSAMDSGAMYLRGLLWRVHEEAGDGTATAAAIFAAALAEGRRAVAAGIPAQLLRAAIEREAATLETLIAVQAVPVAGEAMLRAMAFAIGDDAKLAALIGEALDVVGAYGQIDLRKGSPRESVVEFVAGSFWESMLLSTPAFTDLVRQRTEIANALVLLTNLDLESPADLIPVLEAARTNEDAGGLLILCTAISPAVAGFLHANSQPGVWPILAARTPAVDRSGAIADLATLTGATPLVQEAGMTLATWHPSMLGSARTTWVTRTQFGIVSGGGNPTAIRHHVSNLRSRWNPLSLDADQIGIRDRLGRLYGMSATIRVGGATDAELTHRTAAAERTIRVLRGALDGGVVPGGGASFLHALAALPECAGTAHGEIASAARLVVSHALRAPISTMLANAGYPVPSTIAKLDATPEGTTFDVMHGQMVDALESGIVDPVHVVTTAVRRALHAAVLALTIDVLLHTGNEAISVSPEGRV